jgi:DNA replication protein DnaC
MTARQDNKIGQIAALLGNPLKELEQREGECEKHGKFVAYVRVGKEIACTQCIEEKMREESRKKWFEDRVAALKRNTNVPQRFSASGFRDWIPATDSAANAKSVITQFMREVSKSGGASWMPLVLAGSPGTGKTHLLCALVNNLAEYGVYSRYTTLQAMLADIKSAYSTPGVTEDEKISRYVLPDFLALDEIDVMRGSDSDKALLFSVVNGRYNALKTTAVATNQMPEALGEYVTERVISRLLENATTVRCDWPSAR